ncbi:unnamed protein product, partial [Timema podura]|nr:unnamed protein product [Timema podura]
MFQDLRVYKNLEIPQKGCSATVKWTDFEVVYQNTIGVVHGGGVEIQGLKIFHEEIIRNNEVVTKLQGVKFLPHINPRLTKPSGPDQIRLKGRMDIRISVSKTKVIVFDKDRSEK